MLGCVHAPHRAELPHTSDFLLWLQMASLADVARVNGPAQGYYRVHSQSLTRTVHADVLFDLRQRADAFTAVFAGPGVALPMRTPCTTGPGGRSRPRPLTAPAELSTARGRPAGV